MTIHAELPELVAKLPEPVLDVLRYGPRLQPDDCGVCEAYDILSDRSNARCGHWEASPDDRRERVHLAGIGDVYLRGEQMAAQQREEGAMSTLTDWHDCNGTTSGGPLVYWRCLAIYQAAGWKGGMLGRAYRLGGHPWGVIARWRGAGPRNALCVQLVTGELMVRPFRGLRRG